MNNLQLGIVGNSNICALIDPKGEIKWCCLPRFDADPVFCSLLQNEPADSAGHGFMRIELSSLTGTEQQYLENSAILITRLFDDQGGAVEIIDFAPRFRQYGRLFCPAQLVRIVRPLSGSPRIRVLVRPSEDYGARRPAVTFGSNHIRFVAETNVMRLTTDCSITAVLEETSFILNEGLNFLMGPDETFRGSPAETVRHFQESTADYWRTWIRGLSIPFEWQEDVFRAAVTLKLAACDDTGAIIAAPTTSIPEHANSGRNWDYRFCWLRDAYFVVHALNSVNATRTMERYLGYVINVAAQAEAKLQPVYRISGKSDIEERIVDTLPGFLGMGPVRVGNQAFLQEQHDVYGSVIVAATHAFFDSRLAYLGNEGLFRRLESLGKLAVQLHATPDAGPWELRGRAYVHTYSSVMCWAACDRLAKIASRLQISDCAHNWKEEAEKIHNVISTRAWSSKRNSFVSTFEGQALDSSLLLLVELGFLTADDPRFASTVNAIESDLRHGDFVLRYKEPDDFGAPANAFTVCSFWYVDALVTLGRRDEARALFEKLLAMRNHLGLLSEDIDPVHGELWGNFPQTYSMVGLINSAIKLSVSWDDAF